jgi:hypothetical protein
MSLSIVMPSHGGGLLAYSRIAHACAFASGTIEIVVRDNSENTAKREFLKLMPPACRIVTAPACDRFENVFKAIEAASGAFVFVVPDDDYVFDRAIRSALEAAENYANDHTVTGITGTYVQEQPSGSQLVNYRGIDLRDASERIGGYLDHQGPNLLGYCAMRREVALDAWRLVRAHPIAFSFHERIVSLLALLAGRFVHINRLLFAYDSPHEETSPRVADDHLKQYTRAGMDPAFARLHWLLLAFEGARLIVHSRFGAKLTASERQRAAGRWFQAMFGRFAGGATGNFGSKLGSHADAICAKWRARYPNFQLDELLDDICIFMAMFAPAKAELYRAFWTGPSGDAVPAAAAAV